MFCSVPGEVHDQLLSLDDIQLQLEAVIPFETGERAALAARVNRAHILEATTVKKVTQKRRSILNDGMAAENELIVRSIPGVMQAVLQYEGTEPRVDGLELEPEDRFQEAALVMIEAVRALDPGKPQQIHHVTRRTQRTVEAASLAYGQHSGAAISEQDATDLSDITTAENELYAAGMVPVDSYIAETARMSLGEVETLRGLTTIHKADSYEQRDESSGYRLADALAEDSIAVGEAQDERALAEAVQSALATLDERERDILERRFGFNDRLPQTLREIGKIRGITQERVRQLEGRAIRQLAQPSTADSLAMFIIDADPNALQHLVDENIQRLDRPKIVPLPKSDWQPMQPSIDTKTVTHEPIPPFWPQLPFQNSGPPPKDSRLRQFGQRLIKIFSGKTF